MKQLKVAIIDQDDEDRYKYKDYLSQTLQLDCSLATNTFKKFLRYHKILEVIDIVLFEIKDYLPHDYLQLIYEIKKSLPFSKLIIFTDIKDELIILSCIRAGADGFLLKGLQKNQLVEYLASTKIGAAISPQVAYLLLQKIRNKNNESESSGNLLSNKQKIIVQFMTEGKTNVEIATQLHLTIHGIQYHIREIYKKLNVRNRAELFRKQLMFNR